MQSTTTTHAGGAVHLRSRPPLPSPDSSSPPPPPSRRLHSFSFPSLSWGNQRLLRCSKRAKTHAAAADSIHGSKPLDVDLRRSPPFSGPSPSPSPEKSLYRSPPPTAGTIRVRGLKGKTEAEPEESSSTTAAAAALAARPWNLRARRAACNAPPPPDGARTARIGGAAAAAGSASPIRSNSAAEGERSAARFSLTLTRKEIVEDFGVFRGTKPPRRPKKRPRIVQRQIDALLPGFWLSEINPDSYKIDE